MSQIVKDNSAVPHKVMQFIHIILGCFLLIACAQISIPLKPIPITFQTVGVMLIALLYNRSTSVAIILSYLGAGAIGLPVFANFSAGIHILFGESGGYLLGFIPAVVIMNILKDYFNPHTFWGSLINCTVGTVVIFICGLSVLSIYVGYQAAIQLGLLPFILPGIVKAISLALCLRTIGFLKTKQ